MKINIATFSNNIRLQLLNVYDRLFTIRANVYLILASLSIGIAYAAVSAIEFMLFLSDRGPYPALIYPALFTFARTHASLSHFSSYFVSANQANRFPLPQRFYVAEQPYRRG